MPLVAVRLGLRSELLAAPRGRSTRFPDRPAGLADAVRWCCLRGWSWAWRSRCSPTPQSGASEQQAEVVGASGARRTQPQGRAGPSEQPRGSSANGIAAGHRRRGRRGSFHPRGTVRDQSDAGRRGCRRVVFVPLAMTQRPRRDRGVGRGTVRDPGARHERDAAADRRGLAREPRRQARADPPGSPRPAVAGRCARLAARVALPVIALGAGMRR